MLKLRGLLGPGTDEYLREFKIRYVTGLDMHSDGVQVSIRGNSVLGQIIQFHTSIACLSVALASAQSLFDCIDYSNTPLICCITCCAIVLLLPPSPSPCTWRPVVVAPVAAESSPSNRLLKPSKPEFLFCVLIPTIQPGIRHLVSAPGNRSLRHALPTTQPTAAPRIDPGH
jgi:hypothetical protein